MNARSSGHIDRVHIDCNVHRVQSWREGGPRYIIGSQVKVLHVNSRSLRKKVTCLPSSRRSLGLPFFRPMQGCLVSHPSSDSQHSPKVPKHLPSRGHPCRLARTVPPHCHCRSFGRVDPSPRKMSLVCSEHSSRIE